MNFRKIIATLVSMVMFVGIMPTMVFADDETAETSETTVVSEQETPTVIEEETEQSQETAAETQETTVETSAETTGETTVETGSGDITIPASNANEDVVTHTVTYDYGIGTYEVTVNDNASVPFYNAEMGIGGPEVDFPEGITFSPPWYIVNDDGSYTPYNFGPVTSDVTLVCKLVVRYSKPDGTPTNSPCWILNENSASILAEDYYVVVGDVDLANTRFTVSRSADPVNIILATGSELDCSGITVEGSNSLNIWCETFDAAPTGRLVIDDVSGVSAGIGSTGTNSSGAITINGGELVITGGDCAPAIGCANGNHSGAITINNGNITCDNDGFEENSDHAIIGGTSVTINGGEVTVNGSSESGSELVALGGDYQTASVSITGGDVNVNGTAVGIGGNSISITGGYVGVLGENGSMTAGIIGNSITLDLNNTLYIEHSETGIKSLGLGSISISGSGSGLISFGDMVTHPFAGTVFFNTPYTDDEQILYGTYNNAEESIVLLGDVLCPVTRPVFSGHSIVLNEGLIGVNFTVCIPSGYSIPNVINYTVNESEPQVAMNTKSDGIFFTYTCYVSSTQMAETVSAYFDCADQTYTNDYSVLDYVNEVLSHRDSYSEQVVSLVQAIADYGYYAQAYMQEHNSAYRRTSHTAMPSSIITVYDDDTKQAAATGLSGYGVSVSGIPTGIRMTYSLVFDSSTSLRLYVRSNDAISSVTGNYGIVTKLSDSAYMIEFEGISAQNLGFDLDTIRLTVVTEAGSNTITVDDLAPLAYVNALYGTSATGTDLAVAFYRYYEAVRAINGN